MRRNATKKGMDMENAVIYPFDKKVVPFIRYWNAQAKSPKIMSVVATENNGLLGRDIGELRNQDKLGIQIHTDLIEELSKYDTLVIIDVLNEQEGMYDKVRDSIETALCLQKNVMCMYCLMQKDMDRFYELAEENHVTVEYYVSKKITSEIEYIPFELYRPRASVIMIGEMFPDLGGNEIALGVNEFLKGKGYSTVIISEQKWPVLDEIVQYPVFLKNISFREDQKVYYLNNYIRYLESQRKIDAIIMIIPDAMLKYSNQICSRFGLIPFMISQAVCADYFVFCTQYEILEEKFYNMMNLLFKYRYGFEIDSIHMSNTMIDLKGYTETARLSFLNMDIKDVSKVIEDHYKNNAIPVLNCTQKKDFEFLCENLLNKLIGYGDIQCVV